MKVALALGIAVMANVIANLGFRIAMARNAADTVAGVVTAAARDPAIWLGVFASGVLLASYLYAIRNTPLSLAYPVVTGLALVGMLILERPLLGVSVSPQGWIGAGLVVTGIFLMSGGIHRLAPAA